MFVVPPDLISLFSVFSGHYLEYSTEACLDDEMEDVEKRLLIREL